MKKIIIFILSVLLIFSLAACQNSKPQPSNDTSPSSALLEESVDSRNDTITAQYAVGDIIFADGSVVKAENLAVIDNSNLPVAVIADVRDDGTALGLGVHRSGSPLQWESDDTDSKDAAANYPAFNFVSTYAETYELTGVYASGWYMPSIEEVCAVYENRERINTSLQKIYELNDSAAMNGLGTNWYWSSTQSDSDADYAWFVHYFNGYASDCPKNFTNLHVLAVRMF